MWPLGRFSLQVAISVIQQQQSCGLLRIFCECPNDQLQKKIPLEKYDRIMVSDLAISAQK